MNGPETLLSRWSRLKRDHSDVPTGATDPRTGAVAPASTAPEIKVDEQPVDPNELPSIDAIAFDTDIRGFLQNRVPAEMMRAALRRAWTTDPAIRDFIGIAENQWDFNDPAGIPGFGPLQATDDISAILRQALGRSAEFAGVIPELQLETPADLAQDNTIDQPEAASLLKIEPGA